MVVKVPKSKTLLSYQLIERDIHIIYPQFKKKSFLRYIRLEKAAAMMCLTPAKLMSLCYRDPSLLALRLPEGPIYIHPTRVLRLVAKQYKALIRNATKDPNYIPPKRFLPDQEKNLQPYRRRKKLLE